MPKHVQKNIARIKKHNGDVEKVLILFLRYFCSWHERLTIRTKEVFGNKIPTGFKIALQMLDINEKELRGMLSNIKAGSDPRDYEILVIAAAATYAAYARTLDDALPQLPKGMHSFK